MESESHSLAKAIEEDGCSPGLYQYLWSKRNSEGFRGYIPDTIVFKQRILEAWYFTSLAGLEKGTIRKRGPSFLNNEAILKFFTERQPEGFDIVGVYVELDEDGGKLSGKGASSEYFTAAHLQDFLLSRRKPLSGILQRFCQPTGGYNATLRVLWSPGLFRMDRRTNTSHLYDTNLGVTERAATWDGPPHLSVEEPVHGEALPAEARALANALATHVYDVTHGSAAVSRMVLLLRVAEGGKLTLLWASSVRLEVAGTGARANALLGSSQLGASGALNGGLASTSKVLGAGLSQPSMATVGAAASLSNLARLEVASPRGLVRLDAEPVVREVSKAKMTESNAKHTNIDAVGVLALSEPERKDGGNEYLAAKARVVAPADRHDHVVPSVVAGGRQCPSCGRARAADASLVVSHVLVLRHYEALCRLLRVVPYAMPGATAALSPQGIDLAALAALTPKPHNHWPSAGAVVSVSGGIGVYGAFPPGTLDTGLRGPGSLAPSSPILSTRTSVKVVAEPVDAGGNVRRLLVTEVPPTLLVALPRLAASSYRGFRGDPLWLAKTVPVCDGCYIGMTSLQAAALGGRDVEQALLGESTAAGQRELARLHEGEEGGAALLSPPKKKPSPFSPIKGRPRVEEVDVISPWADRCARTEPALPASPTSKAASPVRQRSAGAWELLSPYAQQVSPSKTSPSKSVVSPGKAAVSPTRPSPLPAGGGAAAVVSARKAANRSLRHPVVEPIPDNRVLFASAEAWDFEPTSRLTDAMLVASGVATHGGVPHLGVVRFARAQEVAGMTWPKCIPKAVVLEDTADPAGGFDGDFFAVHLLNLASGASGVMYMQGWEVRTGESPLLRRAMEALLARPVPGAHRMQVSVLPSDGEWDGVRMHGLFMTALASEPAGVATIDVDFGVLTVRRGEGGGPPVFGLRAISVLTGEPVVVLEGLEYGPLVRAAGAVGRNHPLLMYVAKMVFVVAAARVAQEQAKRSVGLSASLSGGGVALAPPAYSPLSEPFLPASLPASGAVLRLIPGHFLGGFGALDRARGFVANAALPHLNSVAIEKLRDHAAGTATSGSCIAPPTVHSLRPGIDAADQLTPMDVAETLEANDLKAAKSAEVVCDTAAPMQPLGMLVRGLYVSPTGTILLVSLSLAMPDGGSDDPRTRVAKAPNGEDLLGGTTLATPGYLLKVYSVLSGAVSWHGFVEPAALKPVPSAAEGAKFDKPSHGSRKPPGNPLISRTVQAAMADTPLRPNELLLAARFVTAADVQRFAGTRDVGTIAAWGLHPLGRHASVRPGGTYLLSLTARPQDGVTTGEPNALPLGVPSTRTLAQGTCEGEEKSSPPTAPRPSRLPLFTLRAHYMLASLPPYAPGPGPHDVEAWARTGMMPTEENLELRRAAGEEAMRAGTPSVGTATPKVRVPATHPEPVYCYTATLDDLRRGALNPFLDVVGGDAERRTTWVEGGEAAPQVVVDESTTPGTGDEEAGKAPAVVAVAHAEQESELQAAMVVELSPVLVGEPEVAQLDSGEPDAAPLEVTMPEAAPLEITAPEAATLSEGVEHEAAPLESVAEAAEHDVAPAEAQAAHAEPEAALGHDDEAAAAVSDANPTTTEAAPAELHAAPAEQEPPPQDEYRGAEEHQELVVSEQGAPEPFPSEPAEAAPAEEQEAGQLPEPAVEAADDTGLVVDTPAVEAAADDHVEKAATAEEPAAATEGDRKN